MRCRPRSGRYHSYIKDHAAAAATPHHRLRRSLSSRRSLWASVQTGYCKLSRRVSHADYHQLSRRIRAYRRSPAVTQDSHISTAASHRDGLQHVPNAPVARRCNRRGRAQHGHRGNIQGDGWRLRRSGHAEFSLPRGAGGQGHSQFYSSSFHVTHRFFFTFLVRPALLPYGKRGFRAAICKIARPQPPAAALCLKKVTFPSFLRPPISRKRLDISCQIAYHESGHNLLRGSIS